MKEEEGDLGTSAWARHLNEASRITPQVKQYFKHFEPLFVGEGDLEVVSAENLWTTLYCISENRYFWSGN